MRDYTYIVKEGDKPSVIAQRLVRDGNRWRELMSHNTILTPNKWLEYGGTIVPVYHLRVGQRLNIPNYWIKDIDNQLIHTTQGFIGDDNTNLYNDSPYFDPAHKNLKQVLSDMQNATSSLIDFNTYFEGLGEIALYFCDMKVRKDRVNLPPFGNSVPDCANNAYNWFSVKGGLFDNILPGNWNSSLNEDEIMQRIDAAKDSFKKMPVYMYKTDLGDIGQIYKDGYNSGYNVGYKQDGINAAQSIIDGTYTLGQQVDGVNTADIPVVIASPQYTPNIMKTGDGGFSSTSYETDHDAQNIWKNYWQQGWQDGYTDGFRETMVNNDLDYSWVQTEPTTPVDLSDIANRLHVNNRDNKPSQDTRGGFNKDTNNRQNANLNKESSYGFPWGWILFGGAILAGSGVGYYYYKKNKVNKLGSDYLQASEPIRTFGGRFLIVKFYDKNGVMLSKKAVSFGGFKTLSNSLNALKKYTDIPFGTEIYKIFVVNRGSDLHKLIIDENISNFKTPISVQYR